MTTPAFTRNLTLACSSPANIVATRLAVGSFAALRLVATTMSSTFFK
eukprot:CAMPEP_0171230786 /NCGR_PEP_ID=MMETSP0790-20130122/39574_1 /TAXON_ID=2925 /ORGANISM="Alexandrium catenella, Strain OF101" /LENGTH=46 /DNA_ID= /DNA_START= /DNA_END= /DNA_ORIENTATION=